MWKTTTIKQGIAKKKNEVCCGKLRAIFETNIAAWRFAGGADAHGVIDDSSSSVFLAHSSSGDDDEWEAVDDNELEHADHRSSKWC